MLKKIFVTILFIVFINSVAYGANDVDGKTWILDTIGSITAENVDIVWIIWTDIQTDSDDLEIWDSPSTILFKVKGKAGIDMIIPFPGNSGQLDAFDLKVLDSGTVQVRRGRDI